MKKIIVYISSICFGLFLNYGTVLAQSDSEIKFNFTDHPLTTDKNLVSVSTFINAQQSADDGILFSVIVKNNSDKTIFIKNIANQLLVALYNERGFDISLPNIDNYADVDRPNSKWKFRSESVFPSKLYINGKEEKIALKMLEYFEIPAGGNCKVNLIIKNVKQIDSPKDIQDKFLKPTIKLAQGKYKLRMWLSVFSKNQNKAGGFVANFQSPLIYINYNLF